MQAVLAEQFSESQSTSSGGGVDEITGLPDLSSWSGKNIHSAEPALSLSGICRSGATRSYVRHANTKP